MLWTVGRTPHRPYPPGPPSTPLLGNLLDLPTAGHEWEAYAEMSKRYGRSDVLYMRALGTDLLLLNSLEAARELLDKRGSIFSDRPRLVMIKELMEWSWNLVLMSYGRSFTAYRRVVQQEFQPSVVSARYHIVINQEVLALLHRLLESPDKQDIVDQLDDCEHWHDVLIMSSSMAGAIIMMITYGHQVATVNDEYVALAEAVRQHAEERPGTELVDVIPILKYLPTWSPGADFQHVAAIGKDLSVRMRSTPYHMVKTRVTARNAVPCIATRLLQEDLDTAGIDHDEFVKNCCGVVYSGRISQTLAALTNFVLAMTLYPDVQERAHQELDEVIGRKRLPTFEDRHLLPYTSNLVKEVLRWKAVSPLGVPHATSNATEYQGGYIPQGTTVLANIHAMLHDPSAYSNPASFNPDRFSPTDKKPEGEPDPARAAFGFGRRICPGRFFAEDSLWLTIAAVLHVFTISKPSGLNGEASPRIRWSSGLVSHPSKFPYKLSPRFLGVEDLVQTAERD
ncbi:cytochrome P450 [Daedaleopsis nitida]|nr:cytochrome P450 [Daedaleopsis nitida]